MKSRRVLVLLPEGQVPPESPQGLDDASDPLWAAHRLVATIRELGHETQVLGVSDELAPIRQALLEFEPHVVFNQLLEFHGAPMYDAYVVSFLELMKVAYTGCNPRGILLSTDKALAKKILHYHRVPIPRFGAYARGRAFRPPPGRLRYPLFVKSPVEHASHGIAQASIVHDVEALEKRVQFVHESVGSDALVEEYVAGRELYVGVLGNTRLTTLPVWELFFTKLPERTEPIATSRVKWSRSYQKRLGVESGPAALPPEQARAIQHIAKRAYRALELSGYARVDLRLDAEGRPFVLEVNANCDLTPGEEFADAAARAGLDYGRLIARILSLGMSYQPGWKQA
jgi:D-alanine-D-alanine ligase